MEEQHGGATQEEQHGKDYNFEGVRVVTPKR